MGRGHCLARVHRGCNDCKAVLLAQVWGIWSRMVVVSNPFPWQAQEPTPPLDCSQASGLARLRSSAWP